LTGYYKFTKMLVRHQDYFDAVLALGSRFTDNRATRSHPK